MVDESRTGDAYARAGVDIAAGKLGAVFEEAVRQDLGGVGEDEPHRRAEHRLLRPPLQRVGRPTAGGIEAGAGMPALQLAHDALAVAVDVGADLQHGCPAIAARQRRQIRLRHDHRDLDRGPGKAL